MTRYRFLLLLVLTLVPSSLFANRLYFPQVAFGGGYSTTFVIVNTGDTYVTSFLTFIDQGGKPRSGLSPGQINLIPGGSTRFTLPNTGPLTVGWAQLDGLGGTVQGHAILELRRETGTLEATAETQGVEAGNSFILPVEVTAAGRTGIAIANVNDANAVSVRLRLIGEDGLQVAGVNDFRVNPIAVRGQIADFVTGVFPQLNGATFKGTVIVDAAPGTPADSLAATAIAVKEDSFASLPVFRAGQAAGSTSGSTLYFPQVAFGGGYSTTFVMLNAGTANVSSSLSFHDQNGVIRPGYSTTINVPAAGSRRFTLTNSGSLTSGWAELVSSPGTIKAAVIFDLRSSSGELIAAASMPAVEAANRFLLPLDVSAGTSTGIAIANVKEGGNARVSLRLIGDTGLTVGIANDVRLNSLLSLRQVSDAATRFFPALSAGNFGGTILIEAAGAPPNSLAAAVVTVKGRGSPFDGLPFPLTGLPRDLTGAEQRVVTAANAFSLELWSKINADQRAKNVFVSPLSASLALGMTMNGAANQTYDEMRSALQFGSANQLEINEGYRSLITLLSGIDPAVKINIANSIWHRDGFPIFPAFLNTARDYFSADVTGLNFGDVDRTLAIINGWVDNKTNHKIRSILGADDINDDSTMFLINAIYFNGGWREKFKVTETREAPFAAADGTTQTVPLMHRRGMMPYVESETYQAVDLPYGNSAFSMTVLLPKPGNDIESVAASLTPAAWQTLVNQFREKQPGAVDVDFFFPKLKLEYGRKLNDDLQALGMRNAFLGSADFSRLSPVPQYIDFVRQKTFVDISEEGTEAAAVTVVGAVVVCACFPEPPKVMRVDRPYIFAIRERLSGTLLFLGKIVRF